MSSILHSRKKNLLLLELNRPKALNSLDLPMCKDIRQTLIKINTKDTNDNVGAFLMKGNTGGKAFCAGGDVKSIWQELTNMIAINKMDDLGTGKQGFLHTDFFREEYKMNHLLGNSLVPQISIWDGIVMGGGVGISVLGEFRVATEKCVFAMPETAIGLFPDVGSSAWIPHISINRQSIASDIGDKRAAAISEDDGVGLLIGLTGCRLNATDLLQTGIATHLVKSERMEELEEALSNLDMSLDDPAESRKLIRNTLNEFSHEGENDLFASSMVVQQAENISRTFGSKVQSVEEIMQRLQALKGEEEASQESRDWASKMHHTLTKMSPISLKLTFEQIRKGRKLLNLQSCLYMEYRMVMRCMKSWDFREGIRALLVEKDPNGATWKPATLEEVTSEAVQEYFSPLDFDDYELDIDETNNS